MQIDAALSGKIAAHAFRIPNETVRIPVTEFGEVGEQQRSGFTAQHFLGGMGDAYRFRGAFVRHSLHSVLHGGEDAAGFDGFGECRQSCSSLSESGGLLLLVLGFGSGGTDFVAL